MLMMNEKYDSDPGEPGGAHCDDNDHQRVKMIIFLKKIQILTQVSLVVLLGCIGLCILQRLARAEEKSSTRDCYRW